MNRRIPFCIVALTLLAAGAGADETSLAAVGKRIYADGVLTDGESIQALVFGDVPIYGETIVCHTCHRRSGMGLSEGPSVVSSVVAELLYKDLALPTSRPPAPPVLRPAYTRETLARAIRDGVGPDGRILDPLMPLYPLSDTDMDALLAYLDTLSIAPDPGVDDRDIHFAVVIDQRVEPGARQALIDVVDAFVAQKNTETRYETKRATSGPWHKDWFFKPYRKWVAHYWEVRGGPETWDSQLANFYEDRPVFALVNGISRDVWQPVHDFCEEKAMPCLFPTTALPVADREDFYSMYLSRGIRTEAALLAEYLGSEADFVVQLHDEDNLIGGAASEAFAARLPVNVTTLAAIGQLPSDTTSVVAWVGAESFETMMAALPSSVERVFVSATLLGAAVDRYDGPGSDKLRIVYSKERSDRVARLLMRSTGWFRAKRIHSAEYAEIQANAYFALKMFGAALQTIRGYFVREYFVESLEHMIDNANYTSVYPRMNLAPDQRFVAKGAQIARIADASSGRLETVVDWSVPLD